MSERIRIAIVDDHPIYREGLATVLRNSEGFTLVAEGADSDDAISISRDLKPSLMLLDIHLPGSGLAAASVIVSEYPTTRVVMLTVSEDESHVKDALAKGVSGYIVKGVSGADLVTALRAIHDGGSYVSAGLAARLISQRQAAPVENEVLGRLTLREFEITHHVARGMTNKEVARALSLSEKTVKHHMTRIMSKLQVRNRSEVVLVVSGKGKSSGVHPMGRGSNFLL